MLVVAVHDVRVAGVERDPAGLAAEREPVAGLDHAVVAVRQDADRRAVLLRAIDPVREAVVGDHVIELPGRLVVLAAPGLPSVDRQRRAAVIAVDHAARIVGIDPQAVMIAVRRRQEIEGLAAVLRAEHPGVERVDRVGLPGIGEDVAEVPGALAEPLVAVDPRPGRAGVVAAVQPALGGLDRGVDPRRVGRRYRDADPAVDPGRQPAAGQPLPGRATVDRLVQPRAGPARRQVPRQAPHLPQRGVQDAGVARIELHVDRAGVVVLEQHLLPVGAAVGGAEHAALGVGARRVAERRDEGAVGIARIDDHAADVPGVAQADRGPRAAGVDRAVHAGAVRDVAAQAGLAAADVDHVGIRRRDGDRADRRDVLLVEHRRPGRAAVAGLPHAAGGGAEVEGERIADHAGDRERAAAAVRADRSPGQAGEQLRRYHRLAGRGDGDGGSDAGGGAAEREDEHEDGGEAHPPTIADLARAGAATTRPRMNSRRATACGRGATATSCRPPGPPWTAWLKSKNGTK